MQNNLQNLQDCLQGETQYDTQNDLTTMSDFTVVIPARISSARLPNKMILDVIGVPLIVRVARQASLSRAKKVVVATDHEQILAICKDYGITALMTNSGHKSGTDRIAEVVQRLGLAPNEVIINVQGDEPLIDPELINQLALFIKEQQTSVATIAHPLHSVDEVFNPNIVKVVLDYASLALYFSRSPIPYYRDGYAKAIDLQLPDKLNILRHVGVYAYQVSFLNVYHQLPVCLLEEVEALEQLRALYNGYKIAVMITKHEPAAGVDTMEDLIRVRQIIAANEK